MGWITATTTRQKRKKKRLFALVVLVFLFGFSKTMSDLPEFGTFEFFLLVGLAGFGPYILTLLIYAYHFFFRNHSPPLRAKSDKPKPDHSTDWKTSILRPEGISAVVVYYLFSGILLSHFLKIDVIPPVMHDLSLTPRPLVIICYFLVFDSLMWCIHWTQHKWLWLYRNTHAVHHTIKSPSILVALTGYLPDTCLLIILPLHLTLFLVPGGNFVSVTIFSSLSLLHLHLIHSEFNHYWDPLFRKCGIVNSWDHHVHHLKPRQNLAHFVVFLDKIMGTYTDPLTMDRLKTSSG